MTTAYRPASTPAPIGPHSPHSKRWSKGEYNALVGRGVFNDQRVYLFRGELLEMSPMGNAHARAIVRATKVLFSIFDPTKFDVRVQSPFDVPGESMPEPDLLVCTVDAGRREPHPSEAVVIIEVSDSSLGHDRDKALEYAAAGVPEYWIVDLSARCLEIYRDPVPDRSAALGFRYPPPAVAMESDVVQLQSLVGVTVKVADLLP